MIKYIKNFGKPQKMREEIRCLDCGETIDGAMGINEDDRKLKPKPGDISICIFCGHVTAYDKKLNLRELTDAEIVKLAGDPVLVETRRLLAAFKDRNV